MKSDAIKINGPGEYLAEKSMFKLEYTKDNVKQVEDFLDRTKKIITNGGEIDYEEKAAEELSDLLLECKISRLDIENAIISLKPENYFRGLDIFTRELPYEKLTIEAYAFWVNVGKNKEEIYLKFGIVEEKISILVFSNHKPDYELKKHFKE